MVVHILEYVENCIKKIKVFKTLKSMNKFIADFNKKHGQNDDNWLSLKITGVEGEVMALDPSTKIEYEPNFKR